MEIKLKYLDKFIEYKKGANPKLKKILKKAERIEKNIKHKE